MKTYNSECVDTQLNEPLQYEDLEPQYISPEDAKFLGDLICEKYARAFELLKDK